MTAQRKSSARVVSSHGRKCFHGGVRGALAAMMLVLSGCEPHVDPASLGHVIYSPAELPGAAESQPRPDLKQEGEEEQGASKDDGAPQAEDSPVPAAAK